MDDTLIRVIAKEVGLWGLACVTTNLVNDARQRHEAAPAATAALGYGLTAGALLGALLKVQQRVALTVASHGPLQKLVVEADNYGRVRGYVAIPDAQVPPHVDPTDLASTLGQVGLLTVVKDLRLKELYEGVVPLQTGQLDADLVYYLNHSEQTPSLVDIGVKLTTAGEIAVAGGLLLQTLPGTEMMALRTLAERLEKLAPLEELLETGQTPEAILSTLFANMPYETLETSSLRFECSCSWERSEQALIALGRAELKTLIAEGEAVVDCQFCRGRYVFGREALETILEKLDNA
jgi:molecular chaperone Hsp33